MICCAVAEEICTLKVMMVFVVVSVVGPAILL